MEQGGPALGRGSGTTASLVGLAGGLVAGGLLRGVRLPAVDLLAGGLEIVGGLWLDALRMIVLPLVVSQLLVAIVSRAGGRLGRLGAAAALLFLALLAAGALFAVIAAPPLIDRVPADPAVMAALDTAIPDAAREAAARPAAQSPGGWLARIVPENAVRALVDGDLLQVLAVAVPFAIAVASGPPRHRRRLLALFEGFAAAMMIVAGWILALTPLAVFALAFAFTFRSGGGAVGVLVAFVLIVSALLVAFTSLLYPVAILGGRVPARAFARAVLPGQVVAVSTRSSLASLPALVVGAREHLRMPEAVAGFALPLSASLLKVNRPVSSTVKLLFLAHVYGIALGAGDVGVFIVASTILSFSTVGVPGGGTAFTTLPLYLALGIPIEGVVLLEAVDVIPDIFKTLANTTGYMTVSTVLMRMHPRQPDLAPAS